MRNRCFGGVLLRAVLVVALFGSAVGLAVAAVSEEIRLVRDIHSDRDLSVSFDPEYFVELNGFAYFAASDPLRGSELWRTDGSRNELVADIHPNASSYPRNLTVVGGVLYFVADDGLHGQELWRSDGSAEGTMMVRDLFPGPFGSSPASLTEVAGTLFFVARDENRGVQLWRSDGSEMGTSVVGDANPSAQYPPLHLFNYQNQLLFSANDGLSGYELWRSDGSEVGTVQVAELNSSGGASPGPFAEWNGELFFSATDGSGRELWRWNGAGAPVLIDINLAAGSEPVQLTGAGSRLYFEAHDSLDVDGQPKRALWSWDGSSAVMVADVGGTEAVQLLNLTAVENGLYFVVRAEATKAMALWHSDGVATVLVDDLGRLDEVSLLALDGRLFYTKQDEIQGVELAELDVTSNSVTTLHDLSVGETSSSPRNLSRFGSNVLFSAFEPAHGRELWRGGAEVVRVEDMAGPGESRPTELTVVDGQLYFSATDGVHGTELWRSDGTQSGTEMVLDLRPDGASMPRLLTEVNGELAFIADTQADNPELWKSDGAVFSEIMDITNDGTLAPLELVSMDGRLYYPETDPRFVTASSISRTTTTDRNTDSVDLPDPTTSEVTVTETETEIRTEMSSDEVTGLVTKTITRIQTRVETVTLYDNTTRVQIGEPVVKDPIETTAVTTEILDSDYGLELWRSFGKLDNTFMNKDINFRGDSVPQSLLPVVKLKETSIGLSRTEFLYFTADDGRNGRELWYTDRQGITTMVADINEAGSANPGELTVVGDLYLYFAATDEFDGRELWRVELGNRDVKQVKNINLNGDASPRQLVDLNGTLFFVADNGYQGAELWKSDGTVEGTLLVKDIRPGFQGTRIENLTAIGERLYFAADDGSGAGLELWVSDGSEAGTQMLADINPQGDSAPGPFFGIGDEVFFSAFTHELGRELWRTDGTAENTVLVADINALGSSDPQAFTQLGDDLYFTATDGSRGRELWVIDRTVTEAASASTQAAGGGGGLAPFSLLALLLLFVGAQRSVLH